MFKVLIGYSERNKGYPKDIPWSIVEPFESRAKKNHSQSLIELNDRGGLSIEELYCLLNDQATHWYFNDDSKNIKHALKFVKSKIVS